MKLKITLLLIIASVSATAQQFKSPGEYLTYINAATDNISKATWSYTSAVAHSKSARKIDTTREALIKSIQAAYKKVEAIKDGYKGDTEYRDQMLSYLSISEKYINNEYDKIIDMQEVADQSYDYMEAYILARDLVNQKINDEIDKLNANQRNFGKKYGITITEDKSELAKKMQISNEVFKNHTDIYLIFFKASITEENLMAAIEANDLNAIQQNANALEQHSREGLEKLKTFAPFKNDPSMVKATTQALEFYIREAAELTAETISFLMKKQKIEDTHQAIASKKESDRTNAEIDSYNKLAADMNKSVAQFNKKNTDFNNERENVVGNWNFTGDSFISRHVPKS
ncbi:MAG TPA: hypothetical protein VF676_04135 [Flavobacterium sp.]|jgi:hypothetical protein